MMEQAKPDDDARPEDRPLRPTARSSNDRAKKQREDPTEHVEHQLEHAKWGQLPDYLQSVKTRGGQPAVPERYRRFRNAFLKQAQTEAGKK